MAVRTEKSADATAIRPFSVEIPEAEIEGLRRHRGHPLAREGDRCRRFAGRAAGDDAGARALLEPPSTLRKARGEAERVPALRHGDRRSRHPLHPRSLAGTRTRCR